MTRVYTAGPDGRCTVCQRPEAEHAPEAWSVDARACPPAELAARRCETDAMACPVNGGIGHIHAGPSWHREPCACGRVFHAINARANARANGGR